jgi:hypothetical protein
LNQLMRVNDHLIVWAVAQPIRVEQVEEILARWRMEIGLDPMLAIFADTKIVETGDRILFQFSGDITPTMVAEFQRWWEEVTRA